MAARILRLVYRLRHHRLGGWALDCWAVTLVWGASAFIGAQWLLRGRPSLPLWHWLILALLLLSGAGLMVLRVWAVRRSYVVFDPQPELAPPPAAPLIPEDKIPLRVTGWFEVQGRTQLFADLTAYWRTYASREHAVLAIQHPTSFLLAHSRAEDAGMWYMFIPPAAIVEVTPGVLHYGRRISPGLRVVYRRQRPVPEGKRPPKPVAAGVYLTFEDEATRERVWADLVADG